MRLEDTIPLNFVWRQFTITESMKRDLSDVILLNQAKAKEAWQQWIQTTDLDDIEWDELILATVAHNRWHQSGELDFPPRIAGNSKRAFLLSSLIKDQLDKVQLTFESRHIQFTFIRESALVNLVAGEIWGPALHQIEILVTPRQIDMAIDALKRSEWTRESVDNGVATFAKREVKLKLYSRISPHWDSAIHEKMVTQPIEIATCIDLLSQIMLNQESTNSVRETELGWLIREQLSKESNEQLCQLARKCFVWNSLQTLLQESDSRDCDNEHISIENALHHAYGSYLASPSTTSKLRYHAMRYKAINSTATTYINPISYVVQTYRERRKRP